LTVAPGTRPRVLFLAHLLPWPLHGGGQVKSYHVLRALASRVDVTLVAFARGPVGDAVEALAPLCAGGVATVPLPRGRHRDAVALARAAATGGSFVVGRDDSPAMRMAVAAALKSGPFAAVHVDHLQMAAFVPGALPSGTRVVLDQHNVEHLLWRRMAEAPGASPAARRLAAWEWPRLRAFEAATLRRADRVLAVSEADADALRALAPEARVSVVPISVDTEHFAEAPPRRPDAATLLSVGTMYWPPNADGAVWLCRDILPLVRRERPDATVSVVGPKPTAAVRALAELPGASVPGAVADLRPLAADCGAFVVPLRVGSGVRVKILTAFAMGLPVVSTPLGTEGIAAEDGRDLILADTPEAFAAAVLRVLGDPDLARRLGENGRALVHREHAPEVASARLLAVYDELLAGVAV
jgi:glycosyltransferase involved in cell wall biosynthesis